MRKPHDQQKTLKLLTKSLDNRSMRLHSFYPGILLVVFLFLGMGMASLQAAEGFPDLGKKYRAASDEQGNLLIRKSEQYFEDRLYDLCILELSSFATIYPLHPRKWEAWALLSRAYRQKRDYRNAADVDLSIYLENPTSEYGNRAYLSAGRSFLKLGEVAMAKRIFTDLKKSSYFPEISREAEIELRQWGSLEEPISLGQNDDFLEK